MYCRDSVQAIRLLSLCWRDSIKELTVLRLNVYGRDSVKAHGRDSVKAQCVW